MAEVSLTSPKLWRWLKFYLRSSQGVTVFLSSLRVWCLLLPRFAPEVQLASISCFTPTLFVFPSPEFCRGSPDYIMLEFEFWRGEVERKHRSGHHAPNPSVRCPYSSDGNTGFPVCVFRLSNENFNPTIKCLPKVSFMACCKCARFKIKQFYQC